MCRADKAPTEPNRVVSSKVPDRVLKIRRERTTVSLTYILFYSNPGKNRRKIFEIKVRRRMRPETRSRQTVVFPFEVYFD